MCTGLFPQIVAVQCCDYTLLVSMQSLLSALHWANHLFLRERCSFGLLLWEVATRKLPFEDIGDQFEISQMVRKGLRPPFPASCDAEYRKLAARCWDGKPSARPRFAEIERLIGRMLKSQESVI